jgi:hypothetical protein
VSLVVLGGSAGRSKLVRTRVMTLALSTGVAISYVVGWCAFIAIPGVNHMVEGTP